jgi:molybdenum cofactor cytidylyltransferase
MIAAVVPGAGRSRRFGGPKLLAPVDDGLPLIERTLRTLLDAGVGRVALVLAADSAVSEAGPGVVPALADPRVVVVVNPDPERGMLSSIQIGLAHAEGDPVLILPGDMPFVRGGTVATVVAAAREHGVLVSPRFRGQRGHPIAMPALVALAVRNATTASDLSDALTPYKGDRLEIEVDDPGVLRDVDRVGDLDP